MARRKKRKSDKSAPAQSLAVSSEGIDASFTTPPTGDDSSSRPDLNKVEQSRDPVSAVRPSDKKSGVSVATAIIGMFLTLVFGLYVGSLLPGLFMNGEGSERPTALSQPGNQPQAQISASQLEPSPSDKGIPPELRQQVAELERRAAANPASALDWVNLGNIYFDAHLPQESIKAYEHALSLAPNNPDVLTDMGIMYREIGRYEKAVECFRRAVELEPGHQNALFNAGLVLSDDLKLKAEAAAMWEELLKINPQAQAPNGRPLKDMVQELRQ